MARDPSKTEKATPKQIKKAREKGNVPKSQELTKVVSLLAGLSIMSLWLQFVAKDLMNIFRLFLGKSGQLVVNQSGHFSVNEANLGSLGLYVSEELAKMLLPIFLSIAAFVFLALRIQVGKLWTTEVFKFKLSKFNPINGLKRMFLSPQTFIRLGKSLLQAIFIGFAPYLVLKGEFSKISMLYYMDALGVATYILDLARKVVLYTLVPMIIIALADLWYTRWSYQDNLKMSKQEVKDERKQMEGDEAVKMKMRQKMMSISGKRMMQQVPKADVVITNPTHIAVALLYDPDQASAPIIVAKGAGNVAQKIRDLARENGVPIRENKPLARALYKQTEVGDMIPAELFQAVAAILAQIWKTKPLKHAKQ